MDCVKLLMDQHCSTGIKSTHRDGQRTAVDVALEGGNRDIAEFITNYQCSPKDPLSSYPSFKQLNKLRVEQWFQFGFYFDLTGNQLKSLKNNDNPTADILVAAKVKNIDLKWVQIVQGLLNIGDYELAESVCIQQGEGFNVMSVSVFYGWLDFLKYLMDIREFKPNEPVNKAGDTLLAVACIKGHINVIDYLVKVKCIDPEGQINAAGDTLQSLAESYGLAEVVKHVNDNLVDFHKQKEYLRRLDELINDTENTFMLHYLKMYFIGSSGIGKSTTRKRLTGLITNLASMPEEERIHCSTYLAEHTQVLALMGESGHKLTLQVSNSLDEETQMLFSYMHGCVTNKSALSLNPEKDEAMKSEQPLEDIDLPTNDSDNHWPLPAQAQSLIAEPVVTVTDVSFQNTLEVDKRSEQIFVDITSVDVDSVIARLHSIVGTGQYEKQLFDKILLNLVDVGGQPGFLEMLPFLSKGPGMFLVFFPLDKDLDEPCEVSYEREGDKITPYKAIYTMRETLSKILSAISHHVTFDSAIDQELVSKLGDFASSIKPVATLVGTLQDKLEMKIKAEVLQEKLSTNFPNITGEEIEEVIRCSTLTEPAKSLNDLQCEANQYLTSTAFSAEVQCRFDQTLKQMKTNFSSLLRNYKSLLNHPGDQSFFTIDNYNGTNADLDPLREHLQVIFKSFFKDAKLPIRPPQLLFGVVLRKEYDIVSMSDCFKIGNALNMGKEEVRFTVWYLDRCVGVLIYHPDIIDEDGWFEKNIICCPQVVFDSISSLIVECLLELHSNGRSSRFTEDERENWRNKGQFSLEVVKRCHTEENLLKVKKGKLIPVDKLVKFLEHANLLAPIITKVVKGRVEVIRESYFIPAILECASPEELSKSPPPDADSPYPMKITFNPRCVPVGIFCAMISRLVSKGGEGILGVKWELVESRVKRNLVAFRVLSAIITLVAHTDCFEIRVLRQNRTTSIHDLCSYVLSTLLCVMKDLNALVCPIIAFDCQCGRHTSKSTDKFCWLLNGPTPYFECKCRSEVTLSPFQECWFTQKATLGATVTLEALPFADEDPSFTFKWIKRRSLNCDQNELTLEKVTQRHCEGYFTCEVFKDGKPHFSVVHCLRVENDSVNSDEDKLLDEIRHAIKDVRSEWYSLAVELDIEYGTRKAIERDYCFVEVCFHTMLRHWIAKVSPSSSWSILIRALKSSVIDRGDIADNIMGMTNDAQECTTSQPLVESLTDKLNIDQHLKTFRKLTWDVRAKWYNLGVELGIKEGTLQMIQHHHQNDTNLCFTALLENWLIQTSPSPTVPALVAALDSPTVKRRDIIKSINMMLTKTGQA